MAHYAFLDNNNIVVQVIVGVDETVTQNDNGTPVGGSSVAWETFYAAQPWNEGLSCKRTSYNNNIRKQYAGIGYSYDAVKDQFVSPKPYPSWTIDANNDWQPPTPKPAEGMWSWNETEQSWDEATL